MRKEMYGYLAVTLAALMWGVGGSAAKFLFNQAVSPQLLVKLRLTLSFFILFAGLAVYNRNLLVIARRDIGYFALLGALGMSMLQFTYLLTISLTNVATAVFLQYLSPIFMALYALIWEKTPLGWQGGLSVGLAAAGGFFIMLNAGGASGISILGVFSGLVSALVMAFNTIYSRRAVREYHPVTAVTYFFGFAALFWWVITPYGWEPGTITRTHWLMFLYIAVFSTVVPFLLYFTGIRYLPPTNVGVIACLEPVIAAVVAYLALGEVMGWLQVLGGLLVVAAVILIQFAPQTPVAPDTEKEQATG
ncbi:MAG: DMT family transporter [Negativicutes bacterium]|nr:DMT family transporter [Negativicutes bacterium]